MLARRSVGAASRAVFHGRRIHGRGGTAQSTMELGQRRSAWERALTGCIRAYPTLLLCIVVPHTLCNSSTDVASQHELLAPRYAVGLRRLVDEGWG
jgi:hypothetical protein